YFWIQASAVASERTFSSAGITSTDRRSCLLPETFEALQILKSGYKNGFISAAMDVERSVKFWEDEDPEPV
ncbi:hypothetical protein M422DRAFT_189223, partial [Sphaerobolus stellatus SS14]